MTRQDPLPTLYVPHGAPTFALRPGAAGAALSARARQLPTPRAILVCRRAFKFDHLCALNFDQV